MLHIIQDPWLSPRSAKSNPRKRSNGGGTGLNLSILNNMDVLRNKLLRELMARNQASSCNKTQFFLCRLIKKHFAGTERIRVAVREEPKHPREPRLKRTKLKRREEY